MRRRSRRRGASFARRRVSSVDGPFLPLTPVRQAGGKVVTAWAVEGDLDAAAMHSTTFTMEWPPKSGRQQEFPEIDRAAWFPLEFAAVKILAGQRPLIEELPYVVAGIAGAGSS